jgi:hypothetical protein
MKPLFIFSLPRSGSTLLQRILGSHKEIATISGESWILLPYLYTLKKQGIYTEYGHCTLQEAIERFCRELPNGQNDYLVEMHSFILRLYTKAVKNEVKYFLDKTPRYHLIVEEIIRLFPEGKFIFLWRNPLAIVASIMETWNKGQWNLYLYKVDLFEGLTNLIRAYETYSEKSCAICYEDLLDNPKNEFQRLANYLEIPYNSEILLTCFNNPKFKTIWGDPTGINQYQSISQEPLEKWKDILANPIRKTWCRNYLKWIGKDPLEVMGYNFDKLSAELNAIPSGIHRLGSDLFYISYGIAYTALEFPLMKHKLKTLSSWQKVYSHR